MKSLLRLLSSLPTLFTGLASFWSIYKEWDVKKKVAFLIIVPFALWGMVAMVDHYGASTVLQSIDMLDAALEAAE